MTHGLYGRRPQYDPQRSLFLPRSQFVEAAKADARGEPCSPAHALNIAMAREFIAQPHEGKFGLALDYALVGGRVEGRLKRQMLSDSTGAMICEIGGAQIPHPIGPAGGDFVATNLKPGIELYGLLFWVEKHEASLIRAARSVFPERKFIGMLERILAAF